MSIGIRAVFLCRALGLGTRGMGMELVRGSVVFKPWKSETAEVELLPPYLHACFGAQLVTWHSTGNSSPCKQSITNTLVNRMYLPTKLLPTLQGSYNPCPHGIKCTNHFIKDHLRLVVSTHVYCVLGQTAVVWPHVFAHLPCVRANTWLLRHVCLHVF